MQCGCVKQFKLKYLNLLTNPSNCPRAILMYDRLRDVQYVLASNVDTKQLQVWNCQWMPWMVTGQKIQTPVQEVVTATSSNKSSVS